MGMPAVRWSADAIAHLEREHWPGNIRELANIVERIAILHGGAEVTAGQVRAVLPGQDRPGAAVQPPLPDPAQLEQPLTETLDAYERMLIMRAISAASGNVAEAARRLRTDRPNLYRRMRRLGIPVGDEILAGE